MAAKLPFQLLNKSCGICLVQLIHFKERRVIINRNQVLTPIKQEQVCAKIWMESHGALVVLDADLA